MSSHGGSVRWRQVVGVGVALIASLMSTMEIGDAIGNLGQTSQRQRDESVATASSESPCPDPVEPVDEPAELGSPVDIDGILILLEEPADTTIGSNALTASIVGKDGAPLSDAMVYMSVRMPAMDHGVSAYPAQELEAGQYRAEDVSLGMAGEWVVSVEVIRQARAPISAAYRVEVKQA